MTKIAFPIRDTELTAARQIVKSIVADLRQLTGIPDSVPVVYNERRGVVNIPAGNIGMAGDELRLESDTRLYVEYSEEPDETTFIRNTLEGEYKPLFSAPKLGIHLVPNHVKSTFSMTVTYRSQSLNTVITWLDTIKHNCRNRLALHYHDVNYTYTIPEELVAYFYDVHTLTESVAGYGYDLKEFNERHYTKGLIGRQNLNGKKNRLAVHTKVGKVLGRFSNVPTTASTDKDRVIHEVEFTYTFDIDKISRVILDFQATVHNQRVPGIYLERFVDPILPQFGSTITEDNLSASVRWITNELVWRYQPFEGVFEDTYDMWHPPVIQAGTSTMRMTPMVVDLNDVHAVVNLRELVEGDPLWDSLYVIFDQFYPRLVGVYDFPITVEFYRVGEDYQRLALEIDESLNVRSVLPLNPRDRHYLRVSITWDLRMIPEILDILRQWPAMLTTLIQILNPDAEFTTVGNGQLITMDSLQKVIDDIYNTNGAYKNTYGIHRVFTVQVNRVITKEGKPNAEDN